MDILARKDSTIPTDLRNHRALCSTCLYLPPESSYHRYSEKYERLHCIQNISKVTGVVLWVFGRGEALKKRLSLITAFYLTLVLFFFPTKSIITYPSVDRIGNEMC